jgi:hypothetical protein
MLLYTEVLTKESLLAHMTVAGLQKPIRIFNSVLQSEFQNLYTNLCFVGEDVAE